MLTAEGCQQRRDRLWKAIAEPVDQIIITNPIHLMYFANYYADPFVFRSVNAGAAPLNGTCTICTPASRLIHSPSRW